MLCTRELSSIINRFLSRKLSELKEKYRGKKLKDFTVATYASQDLLTGIFKLKKMPLFSQRKYESINTKYAKV